jgi:NRPS condensation-like uncharacterized protein
MTSPSTLPRVPAKLRPLSGYERLFLAVDKINGFNFGIAVSFRGKLDHARWTAAFAAAQKRHPLLAAGIDGEEPHPPFFFRSAGLAIPLAFRARSSADDWQRVMESDIAEPFDLSAGPLLRATLLEDPHSTDLAGCDLIVTAHHSVIDGVGVLGLIGDLLQSLSGHALADLPLPPTAEEHVARVLRPPLAQSVPADPNAPPPPPPAAGRGFKSRNRKGKSSISAFRLSPEQTARLQRCVRREQTTIGALLMAAMESALRTLSPALKQAELHLIAPIDLRPHLGNENDFVLSVITGRAIQGASDQDLFASARTIKSSILPLQSAAAAGAVFARVAAVLAMEFDSATFVNILIEGFGHDVSVSNLRKVEFSTVPAGLTVESVWGPSVLLGFDAEHVLGSATFAGALHLIYSSFAPLPGLLDTLGAQLTQACAESENVAARSV